MSDRENKRNSMPMGGRGNIGGGEKAKDFGKAISKLIAYCRRSLPVLIVAVILAIVGSVFNVIGPDYLSEMTNIIVKGIRTGIDVSAFTSVALFLVVLYGLGFVFNLVQGVMMSNLAQRTTKRLRTDLLAKVNRLPLKYFDGTTVGDTLSRITNDVDTIGQSLTQSLSSLVTSVTMFVGALIMMFRSNWIMALAGVATTFIGFGLMMVIIGRSQKYFTVQQKELGKLNGHVEECYTGHTVVKAYNGTKAAKRSFNEMNQELYN